MQKSLLKELAHLLPKFSEQDSKEINKYMDELRPGLKAMLNARTPLPRTHSCPDLSSFNSVAMFAAAKKSAKEDVAELVTQDSPKTIANSHSPV